MITSDIFLTLTLLSFLLLSDLILSPLVLSCLLLSNFLSYLILSPLLLPYRILLHLHLSYLILSYLLTMLNRFLIKYLGTHGGEVYPPAVQELATTAVLRAIKSPVSSFSDRNALLEVGLTHVIFTFTCHII